METISKILEGFLWVMVKVWNVISNKWVYRTTLIVLTIFAINTWFDYYRLRTPVLMTWQLPYEARELKEKLVIAPMTDTKEEVIEKEPKVYARGQATYYESTIEGCVGCRPYYNGANVYFIMANGEVLDDTKKTIALGEKFVRDNDLRLGELVTITNVSNGLTEEVELTDTGQFDTIYGRVADMSLALKNALKCESTCEVEVAIY